MSEGATAIGAVDTSTSVVDSPAVDTAVDTSVATESQDSGEQQAVDTNAADAQQVEGGEVDLSGPIKKAIETLKATDPAAARSLRDLYHQQQAFKAEFPGGLKEVQALKQSFEELGGVEGVQAIQAERQEFRDTDAKLAAGDPAVLDRIAELSPDGFVKLAPAMLDKLAKMDSAAYNHALGGIFASTLDSWNFSPTVDALVETMSQVVDQNGQPLLSREVKALQQLGAQYKGIKELATKAPVKSVDPERQKLEQERSAFEKQKQDAFRAEIDGETQKYATAKYDTLLAEEGKTLKGLPASGTLSHTNMMREIDSQIAKEMAKLPGVIQKLNSLDATGKKADLVAYLNSQFDKVAPKVVQRVAKEWTGANKAAVPAKKPVASEGGNSSGEVKLSQPPTPDQIDWSKTKREDTMNRRAYLKGRNGLHTW
jgi:hypothetical protein